MTDVSPFSTSMSSNGYGRLIAGARADRSPNRQAGMTDGGGTVGRSPAAAAQARLQLAQRALVQDMERVLTILVEYKLNGTDTTQTTSAAVDSNSSSVSASSTTSTKSVSAQGRLFIELPGASQDEVKAFCSQLSLNGIKGAASAIVATAGVNLNTGVTPFNGTVSMCQIRSPGTGAPASAPTLLVNFDTPTHNQRLDSVVAPSSKVARAPLPGP